MDLFLAEPVNSLSGDARLRELCSFHPKRPAARIPVNETVTLFMNDCAVFAEKESFDQVHSKLQLALLAVQDWAKKNHVFFNLAKCILVPFSGTQGRRVEISFFDEDLETVTSLKYLGVIISCDRKGWYLRGQTAKADEEQASFDPTTAFPPRFKLSMRALLSVVRGLVLGLFQYSNVLLAHLPHLITSKLEAAYRAILKTAAGLPRNFPHSAVYASSGMLSLFEERNAEGGYVAALISFLSKALMEWVSGDDDYPRKDSIRLTPLTLARDALPWMEEISGDFIWKPNLTSLP